MTREDIIDLADKAGLETCRGDGWPDERLIPKLSRFAALVAERDTALLRQALEALRMCRAVISNNIEQGRAIGSSNPFFSADVDIAITAIRTRLGETT